jgi:phosphomannomutase / phosphoglucomutase
MNRADKGAANLEDTPVINPSIFREYDIRGLHETELTPDTVGLIGRAVGTELLRRNESLMAVGRDVRVSSTRLRDNLIEGLLATGIDVVDVGEVPTPALYFSILKLDAGGGVQITGSHNPVEFNGFKMCHGLASIYGEQIQGLRRLIEDEDFETGAGTLSEHDILGDYVADIESRADIGRPLKLVIDAGNGCASEIAPALFERLGCEVVPLYCKIDGSFPNHLPDPTVPKYLVDLIAKVKETGADIGIGYDGDADRIGAIDGLGRIIPGDRLLAIFARDILARFPGSPIIFDVKCSQALPEDIEAHGGNPVMWKTGHSLIKARMTETGAPAAGEMSGHIFFKDGFHGYDDAIYGSIRLAGILSRDERTLAEIADSIPSYVSTAEIRVPTTDEDKFRIVAELVEAFRQEYDVIDIDGVRVLFGDGWGLVRASNTQPVMVMRFEARSLERLEQIAEIMLEKIRAYPTVDLDDVKIEAI